MYSEQMGLLLLRNGREHPLCPYVRLCQHLWF